MGALQSYCVNIMIFSQDGMTAFVNLQSRSTFLLTPLPHVSICLHTFVANACHTQLHTQVAYHYKHGGQVTSGGVKSHLPNRYYRCGWYIILGQIIIIQQPGFHWRGFPYEATSWGEVMSRRYSLTIAIHIHHIMHTVYICRCAYVYIYILCTQWCTVDLVSYISLICSNSLGQAD